MKRLVSVIGLILTVGAEAMDSDGDGVDDVVEIREGTNPADNTSFNSFSQGLLAFFPCDGTATDISGNGHDGTLTGNHIFEQDRFSVAARAITAASFDPWAVTGTGINLAGESMTLSLWLMKKVETNLTWTLRIGSASANGKAVHIAVEYPADLRFAFFGNGLDYDPTPQMTANTWYHVVASFDAGTRVRKLYVNGVVVKSDVAQFGFSGDDFFSFGIKDVVMDDYRIYDRVLADSEVTALNETELLPLPPVAPLILNPLQTLYDPMAGETVLLDATALGAPAPTYRWYHNGVQVPSVTTQSTISFTAEAANEGTWRCVATNIAGMDETQTQIFVFIDSDGDGLSDARESLVTMTNPSVADTDGDGLDDNLELEEYLTDPLDPDSDDDGLTDGAEVAYGGSGPIYELIQVSLNWAQARIDAESRGGRLASFREGAVYDATLQTIRDGGYNGEFWVGLGDMGAEGVWRWTDGRETTFTRWEAGEPNGGTTENYVCVFSGFRGWNDCGIGPKPGYVLERVHLDPLSPDTDGDGLIDGRELNELGTDPFVADSDHDGLTDGEEVDTHGSDPTVRDTDSDGLLDGDEVNLYMTNPTQTDSDGDGFDDGFEVSTGFDPALDSSTPDAISSIRTAIEFRFFAANGGVYKIQASADLENWNDIETGISGNGGSVIRFYSIENQPKRWFRAIKE